MRLNLSLALDAAPSCVLPPTLLLVQSLISNLDPDPDPERRRAQEVRQALDVMGLDYESEYTDLEYSVDLALPNERIAIEVRPGLHCVCASVLFR